MVDTSIVQQPTKTWKVTSCCTDLLTGLTREEAERIATGCNDQSEVRRSSCPGRFHAEEEN